MINLFHFFKRPTHIPEIRGIGQGGGEGMGLGVGRREPKLWEVRSWLYRRRVFDQSIFRDLQGCDAFAPLETQILDFDFAEILFI